MQFCATRAQKFPHGASRSRIDTPEVNAQRVSAVIQSIDISPGIQQKPHNFHRALGVNLTVDTQVKQVIGVIVSSPAT